MEIVEIIKQRKAQGRLKIFIKTDSLKGMKEIDMKNTLENHKDIENINYKYYVNGNLYSIFADIKY
jgi:hypothetical protein